MRTFQEHLKLKITVFLRTRNLGSKNVVLSPSVVRPLVGPSIMLVLFGLLGTTYEKQTGAAMLDDFACSNKERNS